MEAMVATIPASAAGSSIGRKNRHIPIRKAIRMGLVRSFFRLMALLSFVMIKMP